MAALTPRVPAGSPAAQVAAFRNAPIGVWFTEPTDTQVSCYITAEGAYASVAPDREPTDHWFGDIVHADGTYTDLCVDDPSLARQQCEDRLFAGPQQARA